MNHNNGMPEPWRVHYAHPAQWDQDFPPLSLVELFAQAVAEHPGAPLVDFYGRRFTYADLYAQARRFAAGLQARGLARGDRVGLFLPNVPVYVAAYYGAMMAGATVVNFSPLYTAEELEAQVADSGTRLLVTLDSALLLPTALQVLRESALERLVVARLADMLPAPQRLLLRLFGRKQIMPVPRAADVVAWDAMLSSTPPAPVALDPLVDLALLQYTGGTTGTPKGAMLTHQNLSANARQIEAVDSHRHERDRMIGVLPLFHVFANTVVLNRTVANGGCIVMLPRFEAGQVLKAIVRTRATTLPGVPTMYQALLDHPRLVRTDFSSLRLCISGGAPLPAPVKAAFEHATGARLVEGYGLTESAGVVACTPFDGENRAGSIGQPLPGTHIRLLDKDDPASDAPPGEPGEMAVTGPQVMQGYWNRPEAAASAFARRDGAPWLRTGDIAQIDADGFLRIVDRSKDMIAVGGFKVFPSQVEAALLHHPAVKEALVIGVPDTYLGEVPRAYVTLRAEAGPVDGDTLKAWLAEHVGKHERADRVVIRNSLPKTMIGKLDRKALRMEVAGEESAG